MSQGQCSKKQQCLSQRGRKRVGHVEERRWPEDKELEYLVNYLNHHGDMRPFVSLIAMHFCALKILMITVYDVGLLELEGEQG